MDRPDVVFDAVIFVRCLINPSSRWGRLVFGLADRYRLVVSEPILREVLEVLSRPEVNCTFRTIGGLNKDALLALVAAATVVNLDQVPAVARDPKDDPYLATVLAAGAEYLVTEDQDLLVIGAHHSTKIVNAATFLALVESPEETAVEPDAE